MWTAILSFFGCGQKNTEQANAQSTPQTNKVEKYVSMMCQTGDITLTLNTDKTFDLTILFWNDKTNQHTGEESLKGTWTREDKKLTLVSADKNTIIYELTTTNMKIGTLEVNTKTYGFKSNDKDFFGTGYDLLEQEETDKFLKDQIKEAEKKNK